LATERLKSATEFKLVSHGNEFHAFTTCSLNKLSLVISLCILVIYSFNCLVSVIYS